MPTYDYRCEGCHHEFDVFQSITEAPLRKCPKCGRQKLRRLIGTGSGIIFKGSGFYETDYKRSRGPGEKGAEKEKGGEKGPAKKPAKKEGKPKPPDKG
jgi:putative FmdB family regulatory protein